MQTPAKLGVSNKYSPASHSGKLVGWPEANVPVLRTSFSFVFFMKLPTLISFNALLYWCMIKRMTYNIILWPPDNFQYQSSYTIKITCIHIFTKSFKCQIVLRRQHISEKNNSINPTISNYSQECHLRSGWQHFIAQLSFPCILIKSIHLNSCQHLDLLVANLSVDDLYKRTITT